MRWLWMVLVGVGVSAPLGCTRDNPGFEQDERPGPDKDTDPSAGSGPDSTSGDDSRGSASTSGPTPSTTSDPSSASTTTGPDTTETYGGSQGEGSTGTQGCVPNQIGPLRPTLTWLPNTPAVANCNDDGAVTFTGRYRETSGSEVMFSTCGCECPDPSDEQLAILDLGTTPPDTLLDPDRCVTVLVYPNFDATNTCVHRGYSIQDAATEQKVFVGFDGFPPDNFWPGMQIVGTYDHPCGTPSDGCPDNGLTPGVYGLEFNSIPIFPYDPATEVPDAQYAVSYLFDLRRAFANIEQTCGLVISFTAGLLP